MVSPTHRHPHGAAMLSAQIAFLAGGLAHAVEPADPCLISALRPGRGGLCRVPLGWFPFLHPLGRRFRDALIRNLRG
jgi:hypothetical protein